MSAQDKDAAGAAVPTDRTGSIKIEAAAVELITEERMGTAESQQVLEANLQKLKAELASEAGSAGSLSFYGVALLHAIVLEQRCMQAAWMLASILLCLLEMLALHSIAFSMSFQKCVYDDDCLVGRVCVRVPKPHAAGQELKFYHQSICADCYDVIKSEADHAQHVLDTPGWVSAIEALTGVNTHYDAVRLTDARTQDRWPYAVTATEFCQNCTPPLLRTPMLRCICCGVDAAAPRSRIPFTLQTSSRTLCRLGPRRRVRTTTASACRPPQMRPSRPPTSRAAYTSQRRWSDGERPI